MVKEKWNIICNFTFGVEKGEKKFLMCCPCGRLSGLCWQYIVGDTDLQKLKPQDVRGNSSSINDLACL